MDLARLKQDAETLTRSKKPAHRIIGKILEFVGNCYGGAKPKLKTFPTEIRVQEGLGCFPLPSLDTSRSSRILLDVDDLSIEILILSDGFYLVLLEVDKQFLTVMGERHIAPSPNHLPSHIGGFMLKVDSEVVHPMILFVLNDLVDSPSVACVTDAPEEALPSFVGKVTAAAAMGVWAGWESDYPFLGKVKV